MERQNWEEDFDLMWGIAPPGTPKADKGNYIRTFIRECIESGRSDERARIAREFKEWRKTMASRCPCTDISHNHDKTPEMCPCRIMAQNELDDAIKVLLTKEVL